MLEPAAHAVHVQQIVPRTFARTRVIEYVCAADAAQAGAAIDAARQRGLADKAAYELETLARQNASITLVATMAEMDQSTRAWNGRRGFIGEALLREALDDFAAVRYYIAGPPPMVDAMTRMLGGAGVPPGAIVAEEFAGY